MWSFQELGSRDESAASVSPKTKQMRRQNIREAQTVLTTLLNLGSKPCKIHDDDGNDLKYLSRCTGWKEYQNTRKIGPGLDASMSNLTVSTLPDQSRRTITDT